LSQIAEVNRALETLKANRRYQQDHLTHGDNRVSLYVDGDWLNDWTDEVIEPAISPLSQMAE
jgi:hypothetical protein